MIKLLIKIRLKEIFSSFVIRNNKKKQSPAILALIAFLMLYLVVVFLGMFGFLFYSVCVPFVEIGQGYLYFSFAALMGFFLCFIGSVFIAQTQLFDSKDNEFLLSMPVKTSDIIASRMFSVLLVNYMYLFVVAAPAGVVYCMHYTPTVLGIVLFVAAFLLLPLLSMTLTCVMAFIFMRLTLQRISVPVIFSLSSQPHCSDRGATLLLWGRRTTSRL